MGDARDIDAKWAEYNDLVDLRSALTRLHCSKQVSDPDWKTLMGGYERLIDHNCRMRYWLQWLLTAEPEEIEQWRNGPLAAGLANGSMTQA